MHSRQLISSTIKMLLMMFTVHEAHKLAAMSRRGVNNNNNNDPNQTRRTAHQQFFPTKLQIIKL
jgi:hypothetical protein